MNPIIAHVLKLTAVTSGLAVLMYTADKYFVDKFIHPHAYYVLAFLFFVTLLTSLFVMKGVKKNPADLNLFFFPAMIFRFFASVIFITVIVLVGTNDVLYFVADFFILYLFYQVFEITSLMTNLRSHLENRGNEDNKKG